MFAHLNTVLTNVSIMLVHLSYFCHSGAMEVFYGALDLWSFGFGKSGILSLIFQQRSWKSLLCICRKAKSNKFVNSTQKLGRGESGCCLVACTSIASVSWLKLDGQFRYFKWQSTWGSFG